MVNLLVVAWGGYSGAIGSGFDGVDDVSAGSTSQTHQLVGAKREQPEHQMTKDLGMSFDHDVAATKFILEAGVGALGGTALTVTHRVSRFEVLLVAATRVVIDQRHMPHFPAVGVQLLAAVGGIHQVVQVGDALPSDVRQRHGGATVMHRSR